MEIFYLINTIINYVGESVPCSNINIENNDSW